MADKNKSQKTVNAVLSNAEVVSLINLAGAEPNKASPLYGISGKEADTGNLQKLGLLAGSPSRLTDEGRKALNILAGPDVEIKLIWGNPARVNFSTLYATNATGSQALVVFSRDENGGNHFGYFLTHADMIDLIITAAAVDMEIKDPPNLSLDLNPESLPVFWGVLDLYREARLRALLDRRTEAPIDLSADELTRVHLESNIDGNLSWYGAVGNLIMPGSAAPFAATIQTGLDGLKKAGAITAGSIFALSQSLNTLAERAFPIISFVGAKVIANRGTAIEGLQFALIRGMTSLLLMQLNQGKSGDRVRIDSISTSEIPELLINVIALPFEVVPAAPAPSVNYCPGCGTPVSKGKKFCAKCGQKLA